MAIFNKQYSHSRKHTPSVRRLCGIALFAAAISVSAFISIPLPGGVPMTMQTMAVFSSGIILGAKDGALSAALYILLGAAGLPVFSGLSGGFGTLIGPTGGFILSFPAMALLAGLGARTNKPAHLAAGLVFGSIINFLCGAAVFIAVTSGTVSAAFTACVLPFIPGEALKASAAWIVGIRVKKAVS